MTWTSKELPPRGEGYCPLETAYGHGHPTEYCQSPSYELDPSGWCEEHLYDWGYKSTPPAPPAVEGDEDYYEVSEPDPVDWEGHPDLPVSEDELRRLIAEDERNR